jgi:hypothetical protein
LGGEWDGKLSVGGGITIRIGIVIRHLQVSRFEVVTAPK